MRLLYYSLLTSGFAGFLLYAVIISLQGGLNSKELYYAYVNQAPLKIFLANTPETRQRGLSGLQSLPEDRGLLFVFNTNERYGIWMKDMQFPIDIMWMDENFNIIHIKQQVQPSTYPTIFYPPKDARFVLETNAGFTDRFGITVGDSVKVISYKPGFLSFKDRVLR